VLGHVARVQAHRQLGRELLGLGQRELLARECLPRAEGLVALQPVRGEGNNGPMASAPAANETLGAVDEPARCTPLLAETEVLVLGGGPAGLAAAASAAAAGRAVLLVERYGFLGGMGTAAGVTNFCGLHANVYGDLRRVVHGVADELLQRIDALGGLNEPHSIFGRTLAQAYDNAAYKCAADELLLSRGVQLLFHVQACGVHMHDAGHIDALLVETRSGRRAIRARTFSIPRATANCSPGPVRPGSKAMPRASCCTRR